MHYRESLKLLNFTQNVYFQVGESTGANTSRKQKALKFKCFVSPNKDKDTIKSAITAVTLGLS